MAVRSWAVHFGIQIGSDWLPNGTNMGHFKISSVHFETDLQISDLYHLGPIWPNLDVKFEIRGAMKTSWYASHQTLAFSYLMYASTIAITSAWTSRVGQPRPQVFLQVLLDLPSPPASTWAIYLLLWLLLVHLATSATESLLFHPHILHWAVLSHVFTIYSIVCVSYFHLELDRIYVVKCFWFLIVSYFVHVLVVC